MDFSLQVEIAIYVATQTNFHQNNYCLASTYFVYKEMEFQYFNTYVNLLN